MTIKTWALLDTNNHVINVTIGETATGNSVEIPAGSNAGIGWVYDGVNFIAPTPPTYEPVVPPVNWKITRLAMRNRFTTAEKVALYELAKTNTLIQIFLDDLAAATFIDLQRDETVGAIGQLVTVGLLTSARGTEILTTEPSPDEVYRISFVTSPI